MKIAFIGTGNMGGALARAASKKEGSELLLVNRHPEKAERLSKEIGGTVVTHETAVREAEMIFIGVKPVMLSELCGMIRRDLGDKASEVNAAPFVLVSMVAGVSIADLQGQLGAQYPVIRIMPNTPVSVGEGMILYSCSEEVTEDQKAAFLSAMQAAGSFLPIEERLMGAGMAVSGCGPAYVDLFVESLADAGVAGGLTRKDAMMLAAQTVLGSAKLILESGKHPGVLKDEVCSPGGTTIQGVRKLEEKGFRSAVIEAALATDELRLDQKLMVVFWQLCINNQLFSLVTENYFIKSLFAGRLSVYSDEILSYLYELRRTYPDELHWSDATLTITASKYLTLMKKLGLATGYQTKEIKYPIIGDEVFEILVRLALAVYADAQTEQNPLFRFSFLDVETLIKKLKSIKFTDKWTITQLGNHIKIDMIP